ncbi:BRD4-interacting chromatin-remodeling complex-associated protein isoform X2 [Nelusetta ayraudi]|uniref:BRD4-interacting chromatin-remodeling complex-associated protein isoform X2 n=1 Tax=Nelusetta ayraudi TaxID=303726 RepID=UPI003F715169
MEDEDGTCLLDVLCDPQALNDFLHGTHELQTEDLLISASSGEPSLFADAPSPVSLLGDGRDSPDTPPPGCVDLSFLEEALLSSPEAGEDLAVAAGHEFEVKKGAAVAEAEVEGAEEEEEEEVEEVEVACDILQQSLQEADITEQTMALEAGLPHPADSLSLYSPAPLLAAPPSAPKAATLPLLPRDTQAAVEPPQPSLLAVGPGCPSLKPAAPPQLMGLVPGSVFPAASPDSSFSLSPAHGSSMIIHKAVSSRPLISPSLRAAVATAAAVAPPGLLLQRAPPLHIQPKLPISIQPRLVHISPKPSGQKPAPALTFVPGTASPNILLTPPPGQKLQAPPPQPPQQLPKPVSLQLVNQGGSFVLQPQGLFQGQNQFLLPGQCPVTISQPLATAPRPLLTHGGHQGLGAPAGQLLDGSQILTVPQRQLNFSPVFAAGPAGQLALRQATVLSGPLQLQSAPPTVFQVPAQLAGTYAAPGGQGQRATLVHTPAALGNHITLINSSAVLPQDLTSISIVNGPSVVQGLPFATPPPAPPPQTGLTEGQLSLQQASVVLLPERGIQEERTSMEEATFHHLPQPYAHVLQQVAVQSASCSPPVVTVLQPAAAEQPLLPDAVVEVPKLPMPPADSTPAALEEVAHSLSHNQAFMQHLQQQALSSPIASELLVGDPPVAPTESLDSPGPGQEEIQPEIPPEIQEEIQPEIHTGSSQDDRTAGSDRHAVPSPPLPGTEDAPLMCSSPPFQDSGMSPPSSFCSPPQTEPPAAGVPAEPSVQLQDTCQLQDPRQHQDSRQLQVSQWHIQPPAPQPPAQISIPVPQQQQQQQWQQQQQQQQPPSAATASYPPDGDNSAVPQQTHSGECQRRPPLATSPSSAASLLAPAASLLAPATTLLTPAASPAEPTAALLVERNLAALDAPRECDPIQSSQQSSTKQLAARQQREERLTPAMRRLRFQQRSCMDHAAVQSPLTGRPFSCLQDTVGRLLPYHTCAGHLPNQQHFTAVDQEFDSVSCFLLKRTKDMVNKYRQLLVREAQESPSAEMVMLERLFLQAERHALAEDRRRVRRDPESFMSSLASSTPAPPPRCCSSSSSPSSPPAWTRLSDRPPGLKTYCSSSRGALRLTIKQESGSRKVVRNSACDPPHKRDHSGRLTNGAPQRSRQDEEVSNGALTRHPADDDDVLQTALESQIKAPPPPPPPPPKAGPRPRGVESPHRDAEAPRVKSFRLDASPAPLQEDNVLSDHLQSAIDSILELQRLQGASAGAAAATPGPSLDPAVTSMLEGHL